MHGRGRETFSNGECFIVYYKNGYKLEALASKTTSAVMISHHDNPMINQISNASSQNMLATAQSGMNQTLIGNYRSGA